MSNHEDLKDQRIPACLHWSVDDVAAWIEEIGFPFYKDCFKLNEVNGRKLILSDASALPRMGITDFEHIKIIAKSIRDLLTVEEPYWNRSLSLPPREALGMYLERRSITGEKSDEMTYVKFLMNNEEIKWQPPLSNHCLILPPS